MENQEYRHEPILTNEDMDISFSVRHDPGSYVTKHWHEAIEIIYFLEGNADFFLNQQTIRAETGQCMVINANVVHSSQNMTGNRCILIQIPLKSIQRYVPDLEKLSLDVPLQAEDPISQKNLAVIKKIMIKMQKTLEQKEIGYALRFNGLVYELLYQLFHNFHMDEQNAGELIATSAERNRLEKIMEYTQRHYAESISISQISSIVYLQPEYFCRYFKKCMGITYLEYLNELRLSYSTFPPAKLGKVFDS